MVLVMVAVLGVITAVTLVSLYAFNVGGLKDFVDDYQRKYDQPGNIGPPYVR
jgi:hypothetical protein